MKVWTTTKFEGHYPVGTAAVIVAETIEKAVDALEHELDSMGIGQIVSPDDLDPLDLNTTRAIVLNDGDY